ncbi:hypothetical protein Agub_g2821, partial [Astrephomene gubernaculifera]
DVHEEWAVTPTQNTFQMSMEYKVKPDPGPILDLITAFRASQALFAAVELGIFDCLAALNPYLCSTNIAVLPDRNDGCVHCDLQNLCDAVSKRRGEPVSLDGLDRLCRTCVALGMLRCPEPGRFALTPMAATYLVSTSPDSLTGYCTHSQQVVWPLFGGLTAAVVSGSHVWSRQFGTAAATTTAITISNAAAAAGSPPAASAGSRDSMAATSSTSTPPAAPGTAATWGPETSAAGAAAGAAAAAAASALIQVEGNPLLPVPSSAAATAAAEVTPAPARAPAAPEDQPSGDPQPPSTAAAAAAPAANLASPGTVPAPSPKPPAAAAAPPAAAAPAAAAAPPAAAAPAAAAAPPAAAAPAAAAAPSHQSTNINSTHVAVTPAAPPPPAPAPSTNTAAVTAQDVFARIYSTPSDVLRFLRGMHSFAALSAGAVVTAFDLSSARTLLDLGGGTGAIACAACESYPGLASAVVVELPHVVEVAEANFAPGLTRGSPTAVGRVRWLAADFFKEEDKLPHGVDVVVLSRILHDWDSPRCSSLLSLARRLLRPGGSVLLAEMLLQPDRLGPLPVLLQDLNMLCQTHGRERSTAQYGRLLEAAGFAAESVEGRRTGAYLDVVLARKPE